MILKSVSLKNEVTDTAWGEVWSETTSGPYIKVIDGIYSPIQSVFSDFNNFLVMMTGNSGAADLLVLSRIVRSRE